MAGTALDASGNEVRSTRTHGFPLPPPLPGRFQPEFNGNNQYRLPDPVTGELKSYSRATSLAKVLDDTFMLEQWRIRKTLLGLAARDDLAANLSQLSTELAGGIMEETDIRDALNSIAGDAQSSAGTDRANEHGSAVHDWAAWVDAGLISVHQVPEMFRPAVRKHLELLAAHQLIVIPEYTERIVINTQLNCVGTLDRIFEIGALGPMVLGDLKTSGKLDHSWLAFLVQLAFYQSCDLMLSPDGSSWEPMPSLDPAVAFIIHLPSSDIEQADVVPINLTLGRQALALANSVKIMRTVAKKEGRLPTMPVQPAQERWFAARLAVQTSASEAELHQLWTEYQEVWTPDLTTLGMQLVAAHHTENGHGHD